MINKNGNDTNKLSVLFPKSICFLSYKHSLQSANTCENCYCAVHALTNFLWPFVFRSHTYVYKVAKVIKSSLWLSGVTYCRSGGSACWWTHSLMHKRNKYLEPSWCGLQTCLLLFHLVGADRLMGTFLICAWWFYGVWWFYVVSVNALDCYKSHLFFLYWDPLSSLKVE